MLRVLLAATDLLKIIRAVFLCLCFFFADSGPSVGGHLQTLRFKVKSDKHYDDFKLLQATLHVFAVYFTNSTSPDHHHPSTNVTVKVYARNSGNQAQERELINSTIVDLTRKRPVIRLGVRKAVNKWRRGPGHGGWKNLGFEIVVNTPHGHLFPPLRVAKTVDGHLKDMEAQLVTYMKLKNLSARRRRERKHRQTLEVVAAWDTLNKATEEWAAMYSFEVVNKSYPNVPLPGRPDIFNLPKNSGRPHSTLLPRGPTAERKGEERHMSEPLHGRSKRSAAQVLDVASPDEVRKAEEKWANDSCQKHHLWVSFQMLGWNWIIAPTGFNAGFCAGRCRWPVTEDLNPSTHAVIQSLMNVKYPHLAPRTACVPTKYHQLQMLYIDEDATIVLNDNYGDMEAIECGCQ